MVKALFCSILPNKNSIKYKTPIKIKTSYKTDLALWINEINIKQNIYKTKTHFILLSGLILYSLSAKKIITGAYIKILNPYKKAAV